MRLNLSSRSCYQKSLTLLVDLTGRRGMNKESGRYCQWSTTAQCYSTVLQLPVRNYKDRKYYITICVPAEIAPCAHVVFALELHPGSNKSVPFTVFQMLISARMVLHRSSSHRTTVSAGNFFFSIESCTLLGLECIIQPLLGQKNEWSNILQLSCDSNSITYTFPLVFAFERLANCSRSSVDLLGSFDFIDLQTFKSALRYRPQLHEHSYFLSRWRLHATLRNHFSSSHLSKHDLILYTIKKHDDSWQCRYIKKS